MEFIHLILCLFFCVFLGRNVYPRNTKQDDCLKRESTGDEYVYCCSIFFKTPRDGISQRLPKEGRERRDKYPFQKIN
jgi:hypothetical protein